MLKQSAKAGWGIRDVYKRQEENQNNYGVDEANTKFSLQSGVLGGETNYTYLSLGGVCAAVHSVTWQMPDK